MTEPLVEVRDLRKYFYEEDTILDRLLGNEPVAVKAVDGVSFDIYPGETLGLVGESGCGKSTCGETLLRLLEPTDGTVRFDGENVFALSGAELKAFRRNAQIIFQDPFSTLDPRIPIGETVAEPLEIADWPWSDPAIETRADLRTEGVAAERVNVRVADDVDKVLTPDEGVATATVTVRRVDDSTEQPAAERRTDTAGDIKASVAEDLDVEVRTGDDEIDVTVSVGRSDGQLRTERVAYLLDRVGISTDQLDRYPHEFSGGQRQRIGIARALTLEPEFLVLDEPTSALDVSVQAQILNLLAELQSEFDLTYLLISHDLSVVRHVSDRVAVMYLGEIVEIGPAAAIFENPRHPYTDALLESVPRASAAEKDRDIEIPSGDVPSPRNPPSGCRFRTRCPAVIPPADLDVDQAAYRAIMDVRQRIETRDIDLEGIEARVGGDDGTGDQPTDAVVERLEAQLLDVELQPRDERVLRDAFRALAEGDWECAEGLLAEEYASVCERVSPVLQEDWEQPVACHLYEQPHTGESVGEHAPVEPSSED